MTGGSSTWIVRGHNVGHHTRCCGYDPPPCASCSDDDAYVSVRPSGIGNAWCYCTYYFNTTFICQRISTNACRWSQALDPGVFGPCGAHSIYNMFAEVATLPSGNLGWRARIAYRQPLGGGGAVGWIEWTWDSGGTTPFDCTATRTLTYSAHYDPPVIYGVYTLCSNHTTSTCQVN
jgi:hypothetical protein